MQPKDLARQTAHSLQTISGGSPLNPERAWREGTNVLLAYRESPARTEAALLLMLKDCLTYLDYNKTITADQDLLDAVHHLMREFPAMKLEEWRLITYRLKTGVYRPGYERLKLPELCDIFQRYEGERAEMREGNWSELKKHTPSRLSDADLEKMYAKYKKEREAKQKELQEAKQIKRVKTDERGRWEHIPYPNTSEHDGEEAGHGVQPVRPPSSERPPGDG